jgi:glycosyltransferase involved in cell wall biosynthesis
MTRVLHLLDENADFQTERAVELLMRGQAGSAVAGFGRGREFATPIRAALNLRGHSAGFDLVHAWGPRAFTLGAIFGGKRMVYSPLRYSAREAGWIRAVMSGREVHLVCPTDTMRRGFVQRGIPIERCHLIRPGVDFARINRRRDDALRQRLGFAASDFIILGSGESIRGANHHLTLLAVTVLHLFDPKFKLLLWGKGPQTAAERAYARKMLPGEFVSFATDILGDCAYEALLPASDAVLITADAPVPTLPVAIAMAAALPIVSTVTTTITELLEDRHNCLLVVKPTSRLIARRVLDLLEDNGLQWSICDTARTEAYEYFSVSRFINQHRTLYTQFVAGELIDIPQQKPGAGLRMLGRA